jgi:hypothetical protein
MPVFKKNTKYINVSVTKAEWLSLKFIALKKDLSLSRYILELVRKQIPKKEKQEKILLKEEVIK